ncbi:hypothetical protein TTHERM_00404330 (macronuclear) [Tetrahymena thermophila SB210]|uniref:Transmembrane protein n=1 Tax=Tetrahymena thermophila (strain SB210) TaxID=312017 RepID=I7LUI9_TETTS|nr:hypothetical protein TTHERM_00404330 [Tetrahymena thermophila SB210]EAR93863.1 hypothetical protein TTHERM_00404330 [Tetrahymena thermophila SB210]|eukprot:XP_001014108.1 hypothetical protein TTHERM_00404330 [Tetrahymena thermophila SB210]
MKFRITFLLVILILAVATSAKKSLTKVKLHDDNDEQNDDFPDFQQTFEHFETLNPEDEDEIPDDPVGQALYHCINSNYFPWDKDHKDFVNLVNNRCQHYDGQVNAVDFFQNSINCVNNLRYSRQSVKVQFIAAIECVIDLLKQDQEPEHIWLQNKKSSFKLQNKLKRRRV